MTEAPIPHDADVVVAENLGGTRSLLAVAGLFAVNGTLVGGIGATLPDLRVRLGVDAGGLAVVLVSLAAAALAGLGNGAMDVSMNALGVRVEQARLKPAC